MDFTREPIIETIITPKEGCKLVVRSSKNTGQEEYFVDAVEVISFGQSSFFRSLERPKPFLVPVSDYELLEVREARMVLKSVGIDRSIKIGGGREASRASKGVEKEVSPALEAEVSAKSEFAQTTTDQSAESKVEERPSVEKKRDRRRQYRKRRGSQLIEKSESEAAEATVDQEGKADVSYSASQEENVEGSQPTPGLLSSLLQPPPTLISETISKYRENALFKSAFFLSEEEQYKPHDKVQELLEEDDEEGYVQPLQEPVFTEGEECKECEGQQGPIHDVEQPIFKEEMQAPTEELNEPSFVRDVIEMPLTPISEGIDEVKAIEVEQELPEIGEDSSNGEQVILEQDNFEEQTHLEVSQDVVHGNKEEENIEEKKKGLDSYSPTD